MYTRKQKGVPCPQRPHRTCVASRPRDVPATQSSRRALAAATASGEAFALDARLGRGGGAGPCAQANRERVG